MLVSFFATNTLRIDNRIIAGDDLYSIIDCYVADFIKVLRFVMPGVESRVIGQGFDCTRQSILYFSFSHSLQMLAIGTLLFDVK